MARFISLHNGLPLPPLQMETDLSIKNQMSVIDGTSTLLPQPLRGHIAHRPVRSKVLLRQHRYRYAIRRAVDWSGPGIFGPAAAD